MKLVGLQAKVSLVDDQCLEGRIYALSDSTGMLVLEQTHANTIKTTSFHVLRLELVKGIELIEENQEQVYLDISDPQYVHVDRFAGRLQQAEITFRKRLSKQGKNVSPEAQVIFDTISRTTPCRWEEPDIIVYDQVRIRPPYFTVESCTIIPGLAEAHKASSDNQEILQRVNRMLQAIKQRVLHK